MNKNLIVIVGPTAIGKTKLSIAIANHFNCEIISADSRQFYKEMNIGTAVPSEEELQQAKHHFIQHKSVTESYSVGDFETEALEKIESLFSTNNYVILIGGSGLYIDAVTKGLNVFPKVDPNIRESLQEIYNTEGIKKLQLQLQKLDPEYYKKVDIHNPHRVMRALEICIGTGSPYSSFISDTPEKRPFNTISIGITAERETIYNRINERVDIMMKAGLLKEVKSLDSYKNLNALNTVGYKEIFKYLEGDWDLETAIVEIKKNTRRFAKRQLTWFKRNTSTQWFDYLSELELVLNHIKKKSL